MLHNLRFKGWELNRPFLHFTFVLLLIAKYKTIIEFWTMYKNVCCTIRGLRDEGCTGLYFTLFYCLLQNGKQLPNFKQCVKIFASQSAIFPVQNNLGPHCLALSNPSIPHAITRMLDDKWLRTYGSIFLPSLNCLIQTSSFPPL